MLVMDCSFIHCFFAGPSHYKVEEKGVAKKAQQTTSVFASTTNRLKTPNPPVNVSNAPSAYCLHDDQIRHSVITAYLFIFAHQIRRI